MVTSLILFEGKGLERDAFMGGGLMNAKQIVVGSTPDFGVILHIAATTLEDLRKAILKFAKVKGVTGVVTLMIRNP